MAGISWHYVLKFIITGDAAVGKSSLLIRLTDQRFLTNPDPTLGVEFGSKLITIPEEDKVIKLQCWDTAGTESFRSITRSYYRGAAGCLLVYDVTSRQSFLNTRTWLADVRAHADPHLTCILVGNKIDLCPPEPEPEPAPAPESAHETLPEFESSDTTAPRPLEPSAPAPAPPHSTHDAFGPVPARRRQVPAAEAAAWAREEGLLFVEASAKSGSGVDRAFEDACRDILDKIRRGVFDDERSPGVKLSKPSSADIALSQPPARAPCCSS